MIIGLDGYITQPDMRGFSNYIVRLTRSLAESELDRLLVYLPSSGPYVAPELEGIPGIELRLVDFDMDMYAGRAERDVDWHQRALLKALEADQPEVFLGTCQFLSLAWDGPSVLTIHDVVFEPHPEYYNPASSELYRRWGSLAAQRADAILTVSESTARDVRRYWHIDSTPMAVTPLATALPFVPDVDRAASCALVAERLGITGEFLLTPSAGHRRKNLPGAVRAFTELPPAVRGGLRLVLSNAAAPRIMETVRELAAEDLVVVTDWVSPELMPHLYAAATAVLYPTFYEGFGLPVLEAMACGTPVLSSAVSSVPEVAGKAAILVNPHDHDELVRALGRLVSDTGLRETLAARGRARSAEFSWSRTARLTRQMLAQAAGVSHHSA